MGAEPVAEDEEGALSVRRINVEAIARDVNHHCPMQGQYNLVGHLVVLGHAD